jgi:hypothetical protein
MYIFKKFSNWLYKTSTGWLALAGLIIFLVFTALALPAQSAEANEMSGEAGSPDTSFFYTPQDLYDMAEAYREQGRAAYIRARFTFDVIWPIVYTLFLATSLSWLFARGFSKDSRWRLANLAPVFGMIFDFMENSSTSWVMFRYPLTSPVVAWLAPFFTAIKWIFVSASFILLFVGLVAVILQKIRENRKV